jgi:hypothetical protein
MKKNILSLAVAASAAGMTSLATAQMYINTEHTGEALVFPFYSAQGGNDTLISIANTTANTKAVKVRIIEGQTSQETLDFNLYMSPQDHFSFAITADGDGAKLVTNDTSCTVPAIDSEQTFTDLLWVEDDADGNPLVGTAEGREQVGYIEVIEMGQIDNASAQGLAILHAATGATAGTPADCDAVVGYWSVSVNDAGTAVEGAWYDEANADLVDAGATLAGTGITGFVGTTTVANGSGAWNGGGLYGVATVINVAEGTAFGYDAVAIEGLVEAGSTSAQLHYPPGDTRPDFGDDAMADSAIVSIDGTQTTYTNDDALTDPHFAVSALFMTESISNDYVIDADINGLTDWVVTMPTKGLHLGVAYSAPFSNTLTSAVTPFTVAPLAGCQPVGMTGYDREEQVQDPPTVNPDDPVTPDFSPSVRPDPEAPTASADWAMCAESTVVHFGGSSATNSAQASTANYTLADASSFVDGWAAGWAVMDLTEDGVTNTLDQDRILAGTLSQGGADIDGELTGLPVTGFAVVEYSNGTLGDAMANYSSSWEHKTNAAHSGQ